jgi:hypothetical protein
MSRKTFRPPTPVTKEEESQPEAEIPEVEEESFIEEKKPLKVPETLKNLKLKKPADSDSKDVIKAVNALTREKQKVEEKKQQILRLQRQIRNLTNPIVDEFIGLITENLRLRTEAEAKPKAKPSTTELNKVFGQPRNQPLPEE